MKNLTTRDITTLGLLIALIIIFKQFLSVQLTASVRISSYFLVIAVTAAIYGPVTAGIAACVADLLGAILFPSPYGFNPGFTISAFVEGIIYGLFLYNRKKSVLNVSLAIVTFTVIVSYFLNVLWVTLVNEQPSFAVFFGIFQTKVIKSVILVPIQIVLLSIIMRLYETTFAGMVSGLNKKNSNNLT